MTQTPQRASQAQQLARIAQMEAHLDESAEAANRLKQALEQYAAIQPNIQELKTYYESNVWMHDYESDEQGQLPADLKRGVLSQDAVCDLLEQQRELEPVLRTWSREGSDCD